MISKMPVTVCYYKYITIILISSSTKTSRRTTSILHNAHLSILNFQFENYFSCLAYSQSSLSSCLSTPKISIKIEEKRKNVHKLQNFFLAESYSFLPERRENEEGNIINEIESSRLRRSRWLQSLLSAWNGMEWYCPLFLSHAKDTTRATKQQQCQMKAITIFPCFLLYILVVVVVAHIGSGAIV